MPVVHSSPLLVSLVVLSAVLAGCTSGDEAGTDSIDVDAGLDLSASLDIHETTESYDDCVATGIVMPIDKQRVRDILPEGYEPGDAAAIFEAPSGQESPAETGQGFLLFATFDCPGDATTRGFQMGLVTVGIQQPDFDLDHPDGSYFLYAPEIHVGAGGNISTRALDQGIGRKADIQNTLDASPGGAVDSLIQNDDGLVYNFRSRAVGSTPLAANLQVFYEGPAGTAMMHLPLTTFELSGLARCTLGSESGAAHLMGQDSCEPTTLSGYVQYETLDISLTWMPGIYGSL